MDYCRHRTWHLFTTWSAAAQDINSTSWTTFAQHISTWTTAAQDIHLQHGVQQHRTFHYTWTSATQDISWQHRLLQHRTFHHKQGILQHRTFHHKHGLLQNRTFHDSMDYCSTRHFIARTAVALDILLQLPQRGLPTAAQDSSLQQGPTEYRHSYYNINHNDCWSTRHSITT